MNRVVAGLLGLCLLLGIATVAGADAHKEKAVLLAAEEWLALVDGGDYGASWNEAARYFQQAVAKERWEQSLQTARKPLGKLLFRKVKSRTYRTLLPGAPEGQYVVIQFESSFENMTSAVETVTPMREKDGQWRVSGYYINSRAD
jgi:hypothetical protein